MKCNIFSQKHGTLMSKLAITTRADTDIKSHRRLGFLYSSVSWQKCGLSIIHWPDKGHHCWNMLTAHFIYALVCLFPVLGSCFSSVYTEGKRSKQSSKLNNKNKQTIFAITTRRRIKTGNLCNWQLTTARELGQGPQTTKKYHRRSRCKQYRANMTSQRTLQE